MKNIGLYIHVPFCKSICPYCDFYKMRADDDVQKAYAKALIRELDRQSEGLAAKSDFRVDTIYFGGGTPSVLAPDLFAEIIDAVYTDFNVSYSPEFTVECNPGSDLESLIPVLARHGVNRISLGLQSAVDFERRTLGRLSSAERVTDCVRIIRSNGIDNISLDLMLGIPNQTKDSLITSLEYVKSLDILHVSAYMLKLEEGTHFYKNAEKYTFPSDDETADMYMLMCETLETAGFMQYEISNFTKPGYESRHNLKYWHCEEYLGIGAAAHSFIDGKRFFYDADIDAFIGGCKPQFDDFGGDFDERLMLALRLKEGFIGEIPEELQKRAKELAGFVEADRTNIRLTRKGFLVSNEVISKLI